MHFAPRCISRRVLPFLLGGMTLAFLGVGCGEKPKPQTGLLPVSVVTVHAERVPRIVELPGRVDSVRDAQIRARVTGIVQKIAFTQGSDVCPNQLLFEIDPAPYQALYDQATAQLTQAEADLFSAKALAKRYAPLVKARAVSKQEYDNAQASYHQAVAAVAAAKANLHSAQINLNYTRVVSPIQGRIGAPLVTEGALVEAASATQMAAVQQLDPIYVDFTQSTAALAKMRQALAQGKLQQVGKDAAQVAAVLEDGSEYSQPGKLLFTGISVDPTTSQVMLRAQFANPDHMLLPGMYVTVRLNQGINTNALLVPQQALQRTPDGLQSVMRIKDGKVEQVSVTTANIIQGRVVVNSGLQEGDAVVVEGFQKIRPGMPVKAVPWKSTLTQKPTNQPSSPPAAQGQLPREHAVQGPAPQKQAGQSVQGPAPQKQAEQSVQGSAPQKQAGQPVQGQSPQGRVEQAPQGQAHQGQVPQQAQSPASKPPAQQAPSEPKS